MPSWRLEDWRKDKSIWSTSMYIKISHIKSPTEQTRDRDMGKCLVHFPTSAYKNFDCRLSKEFESIHSDIIQKSDFGTKYGSVELASWYFIDIMVVSSDERDSQLQSWQPWVLNVVNKFNYKVIISLMSYSRDDPTASAHAWLPGWLHIRASTLTTHDYFCGSETINLCVLSTAPRSAL